MRPPVSWGPLDVQAQFSYQPLEYSFSPSKALVHVGLLFGPRGFRFGRPIPTIPALLPCLAVGSESKRRHRILSIQALFFGAMSGAIAT